ncbi:ferritin-like protein [Kitasatospora sp. NPDC088351]|uniref:ferritin-like domain-containing protein n=1 Tax=unclassified Kitasatospora TaxID=2633591 RepID=UPI003413D79B
MTGVLDCRGVTADGLMRVDDADCGPEWLRAALQLAVLLELATIPVYSCGLWSIKDPHADDAVHTALRDIVFDEMTHLALAANILRATGSAPVLTDPRTVPAYPGPLPGGLRPGLTVHLTGLDRQAADMYARIELPDRPLAADAGASTGAGGTMGAFYAKVRTAVAHNRHLFDADPGPQLDVDLSKRYAGGSAITPIRGWQAADTAIGVIMEQSEGTGDRPDNPYPAGPGEPAHYYVFREIARGRKLARTGEDGEPGVPAWDFTGPPVPMPATHPMGRVPGGGWANDPVNRPTGGVEVVLDDFNAHYSSMLRALESVWRATSKAAQYAELSNAIRSMGHMRALARVLVRIPLPDGQGATYGPEFRYVDREP